jgi:hypothetical protein
MIITVGKTIKKNTKTSINMSYPYPRTQYFFDLSGVKCKSNSDVIRLRRQWETFEKVENYDDDVYQNLLVGDRGTLYYQYMNREEATDYRNGQIAHINRYPWLDPCTFDSIRYRPFPNVPSKTGIPHIDGLPKICSPVPPTLTSSEHLSKVTDMNTYVYVSSYNGQHEYKYTFTSDDEKMAYYRAERIVLSQAGR